MVVHVAESFPKTKRLRRRAEFRAVQDNGRKVHTPHFVVFVRDGQGGEVRVGITTSRKVGNAVVRNRVRRYVREAFRRHQAALPQGKELVVVAKRRLGHLDGATATAELLRAWQRV